jgi:tRNA(Ile)-lysidine synthase
VDVIATAHTLDDQAETAMMKLLRGAWTEGLGGISPVVEAERGLGEASNKQFLRRSAALSAQDDPVQGGRIVRPMLRVRRSEVEAFLRERGQAWREDSGNTDLSLTRNRVRHVLMPLLRSFNPQADAMLANVAALAGEDEGFWQAEVARVLPQVLLPGTPVRGGGRAVGTAVGGAVCALELERLRVMPAALRSRVVRSAAQQLGVRLSFDETAKVLAAAGFGTHPGVAGGEAAKPGCKVELRAGLRAERSARELRLSRSAV